MAHISRRGFLRTSSAAAAGVAADLGFLADLSHAAAGDTSIRPGDVSFGPETDRLLRLIRTSSREECVPAFAREVKNGLSYRQFLTVLFLAALENGDPHQVAQVYGAHRISSEARIEERLLPLFWMLNRIKVEYEAKASSVLQPFKGELPKAGAPAELFHTALVKSDNDEAVRAALALARDHGPRHVLHRLWEFAGRNVGGNLGHPAIALANGTRTLDAIGWQHSDIVLRYVVGYIAGYKGDNTYAPNLDRVKRTLARLPSDWASSSPNNCATLELYQLLRNGDASAAGELICTQLLSNKVKAGAVWDAISLAAADSLFRYKTGGEIIGGAQVHAITTTNALRYGFNLVDNPQARLINLLQAAGVTADFYVGFFHRKGSLRNIDLLALKEMAGPSAGTLPEVFELLPFKGRGYNEKHPDERAASDRACRIAFNLLKDPRQHAPFMQTARSFLCVKASLDPHDIKFPAAIFEDAFTVSPAWRPYLLASSVHALHGSKSADTAVLVKVREALK
jgi:hypothetical protein